MADFVHGSTRRPWAWMICSALALAGCIPQRSEPKPVDTLFELVNATGLVVDANFFASGSARDAAGLFVQSNIYTGYSSAPIPTLGANQTVNFTLPCNQTASIGVRRPVFTNPLIISGGESADEILLLSDIGFECGAKIRFVYFTEGDAFRVRVEFP